MNFTPYVQELQIPESKPETVFWYYKIYARLCVKYDDQVKKHAQYHFLFEEIGEMVND